MSLDPSLALIPCAFDTGKLYSVLPVDGSGDFTVSRNGTATYFDKDGLLKTALANEPRLEFNTDGTFKGVLVERAATNLILRSEEFENVYWSKINLNADTKINSPTNDLTANELFSDNSDSIKYITSLSIAGFVANIPRRFSIFIKKTALRYCLIGVERSNMIFTSFLIDLDEKTFIQSTVNEAARADNGLLEEISNGWYRFSFDGRRNSDGILRIYTSFSDQSTFGDDGFGLHSFQGIESSMGIVFGAQLETGSVATSYIPTLGSQVTRPADLIQRTNAQDLIGQTEGSLYYEFIHTSFNQNAGIFGLTNNSDAANKRVGFRYLPSSGFLVAFTRNGTTVISVIYNLPIVGQKYKIALVYTIDSFKFFVNGVLIDSAVTTIPEINCIEYGSLSGLYSNHNALNASVFKTPLTDAQAIALTTL
jgi:hypothetical protein